MKILQIIHGYPMRYNAGSEVYTQGLAQALAERSEYMELDYHSLLCIMLASGCPRPLTGANVWPPDGSARDAGSASA